LSKQSLESIEIPVPPLEIRQNINEVLNAFTNKIANNTAMNQTLEKIAQRIFKSWFIDFDPVKANKEGVAFDGLSPEIQALFPSEFEESELGMIPKTWGVSSLSERVNINPKRTLKKGIVAHHIDMKALPTSSMSISEVAEKEFKSGTKFQNHDTLLARITPCLENGKTAYVNCIPDNEIAWGSTEFIVMNPKLKFFREYVYLLARTEELRAYAIKNMTGTSGRQRVSGALVGEYLIVNPSDSIVEEFHRIAEPLFSKIAENTKSTVVLEKIRDRLLPKLISGQITVGEAQKELAEAI
ncbi:restriction endonuclease subunit S, partial [Vibrio vulnificus]|nr:restriction endonuclease subunit S [Vibrio vulnificus]